MAAGKRSARWGLGLLAAISIALLATLALRARGGRASIVLISIDTLRADHLRCYGYGRSTSPFIDSLAAEGMLFENAMVPLPATDPSHASLLTSLHPIRHGVHINGMPLAAEAETMAEVLSGAGYRTMGATAVAHLGRDYGFGQGFDAFSDERKRHARPASEVNSSVGAMLEAHARDEKNVPFFLFVHYFDPHSPYLLRSRYLPPEPIPSRRPPLSPDDRDRVEAYDSEIRFVDAQIERLIGQIGALGLGRSLLVCVVSDHGEQFGEHGFSGGHADFYRETVRVPIVCRGPGIPRGRVDRLVSSMDLAPSLLDLVGARFSRPVDGVLDMLKARSTSATVSRSLLVLGYPSYTRSLQVIEDRWAFIRNLEEVYRHVEVEPLAARDEAAVARGEFREARPLPSTGAEVVYPMPEIDFDPYEITVVVQPVEAGCDASVTIRLEPRLSLVSVPIRHARPLRITYPVSRYDRTAVVLPPGPCAGRVFFKFERRAGEGRGALVSALFGGLRTPRKDSKTDEVFDVRADPGMSNNLIDAPEGRAIATELGRKLPAMYREHRQHVVRTEGSRGYTPAELEMLRSLGYVQ